MFTKDEKEIARLIGRGIARAAKLHKFAMENTKERRTVCLKLAIDSASNSFAIKDEDIEKQQELILKRAAAFEEFING